jgi:hypothetical protein
MREAWNTSQQSQDKREKIQALSLAKDCYTTKLDLLTNATVVDDAINFVAGYSVQKKDNSDKLRKELEDEDIQKEVSATPTANQVF